MTSPAAAGLQPERTRLAWRRSVLAAGVAVLLLGRLALETRMPSVGVAGVALWLAFALAAQRRIHAMAAARPAAPSHATVLAPAAFAVAFAVMSVSALLH
jgi:hypothetical protein